MYAIVRSGGRQHKVAVGDVIEIDRTADEPGDSLALSAVLLVDGDKVTSEKDKLAKVNVTAEVVDNTLGPKIRIFKYKNKTGYRRRQGHRQRYTRVMVTDINGTSAAKKSTAKEKAPAKKAPAKKATATAKKSSAKKTTAKQSSAKKTSAKKTSAKKTSAKKTSTKKAATKKAATKKSKS